MRLAIPRGSFDGLRGVGWQWQRRFRAFSRWRHEVYRTCARITTARKRAGEVMKVIGSEVVIRLLVV